ncbi:E3 ubiquitin-protein ligase DTX3L [Stylophora pistillata]|uniref:E3 ubiquitin-protein ligase n=1 Tax=Stylophora pistillata TaxID=50429 RepID=A0A2B4RBY6_STYPI|nr:E3 ubiquitin-protein ligase DTX3L [Stylophora pistillata]
MLTNNVMVFLYQGDITDEKFHAIVNPANAWLQHSQGVGGAIVKKGGSQIIDDSQYVMSHRQFPLQPGEAVYTRSGHLACHYVIHTVGPDWLAYPDKSAAMTALRLTCIVCLRLAVQLRLSSIALPAISSGNCGMPKEVCAVAIFQAIEEFSTSIDAECSTLSDIRVVIIDAETTEVFRREFINRYNSGEKSQTEMATQRRLPDEEGYSPLSTNRGRVDPRNDDELLSEQHQSVQDNFAESMRRQEGDESHQRVEEQQQQNSKESSVKADKASLANSLEAQNAGGGEKDQPKDESRTTDERSQKTTKNSGSAVPFKGNLAANFSRKGDGVTKGASVGRAMSFKPLRAIKHPPGFSAEDGLNIANQFVEVEKNEQFTDTCDVKNVNETDANKRNTKEEEGKPPDKSKEGSEFVDLCNVPREISASDSVHSNLSAPETEETNASASDKLNAPNDVPSSAAGITQGPGQNTREEKKLRVSSRDASPLERDEDQSQGSQTATRGDHFVEPLCSVCHNSCQELVEPLNCGHNFCQSCVHHALNDVFVCSNQWCVCERSQPMGNMSWRTEKYSLPGNEDWYTVVVSYNFPSGIQGWQHPTQGQPYRERYFTAYLPNNSEGQKVLQLLMKAFDAQLLFTIGKCQVTGEENQIVCNGIEHKINRSGGLPKHGYPDATYLGRVKEQLAKIGIVEDADFPVAPKS